jgi:DNA-binding ferritin-like protein
LIEASEFMSWNPLEDAAMSERIDQFADSLGERLITIEKMIDEAKIGLKEAKATNSDEPHSNSQSVRHKFEAAKNVAKTAESSVTQWLKAKDALGTSVVHGWKDECESHKLEHQAASAEDDAEAGIYLAEAAIVNAVVATYVAIDARRAAEEPEAT